MGSTINAVDNTTQQSTGSSFNTTNFYKIPNIIVPSLSTANSATYTRSATGINAGMVTVINGGGSPIAHNIPATENGKSIILLGNTGTLSATAKVYTNFLRISATSFSCWDTVKIATSGTLKTNNAVTLVDSLTIPGGSLGLLGALEGWFIASNNNSAGAKNITVDYGTSLNVLGSISAATATKNVGVLNTLRLIDYNNQILNNGTLFTIYTTLNQSLSVRAQCVAVNDYVVVNSYVINISKVG